jgi:hypothetical protein
MNDHQHFTRTMALYYTLKEKHCGLGPDHAATHLNLGHALEERARLDEAVLAGKQTLRLARNDLAARQELARLDDHREHPGR